MKDLEKLLKDKDVVQTGRLAPALVRIRKKDVSGKRVSVTIPPEQVRNVTILLRARNSLGYTQEEFAMLLGIPRSTYIKYEQYVSVPSLSVVKLALIAEKNKTLVEDAVPV